LVVDAGLVAGLADAGLVRAGPGERSLALLAEGEGGGALRVAFVAGEGAALEELLQGLRVEADARAVAQVRVAVAESASIVERLEAAGYHLGDGFPSLAAYARPLT
jgi:hypothetical protein